MYRLIITLALIVFSSLAEAHGEDQPGPNGGFIKMPGAFHTEVVPIDKTKLKVFLLDFEWKNPLVKDSAVTVTHKLKAVSTAKCEPQGTHFACEFPKTVDLSRKGGQLTVEAQREKQKGNAAVYQLPLALAPTAVVAPDHSGHSGH